MPVSDLVIAMLREEGGFQKALRNIIEEELDITVNDFCKQTGMSQSTMYKILEEGREPNLRTVRMIVKALKRMFESSNDDFIAVIASHQVLKVLPETVDVSDRPVKMKEYPVATVEDAIIAAIRAERDGALAVICAPIVAPTVERILTIPVTPVIPTTSISVAIDKVKKDLWVRAPRSVLRLVAQGAVYAEGMTVLHCVPCGMGSLALPASVVEIGDAAALGNAAMARLDLPDGVVRIGEYAFAGSRLEEVSIPGGAEICEGAFCDCGRLERAEFRGAPSGLGPYAFDLGFTAGGEPIVGPERLDGLFVREPGSDAMHLAHPEPSDGGTALYIGIAVAAVAAICAAGALLFLRGRRRGPVRTGGRAAPALPISIFSGRVRPGGGKALPSGPYIF